MEEERSWERGPDLWDYWRIILEGRWYIILAFVVVVASTAVFTFTADPVYEASGRVLVLTNREDALGLEEMNLPSSLSGNVRNEVPNWIEMMTSRSALEKAVADLNSNEDFVAIMEGRQRQGRGSLFNPLLSLLGGAPSEASEAAASEIEETDWLTVDGLRGRITVQGVRDTDIIEVGATGGAPREARMIVNALLEAYIQLDKEITHSTLESVNSYLGKQLQQTKDKLESLEEEFERFKVEAGLESGIDQLEQEISQLRQERSDLQSQLSEKQNELRGIELQLEQTEDELFAEGATPNGLRGKVDELQSQRQTALEAANFQKAEDLADEIGAGLDAAHSLSPELQKRYADQMDQQRQAYVSLRSVQSRLESVQATIGHMSAKLSEYRLPYQRYERNISVSQDLYTLLSKEQERAQIANVGQLGSIRIVGQAETPEAPISPKKKLNLILGALVGLTLGGGFAFLREYLDNTFKTPKQVERELGIPSLGAVFERKLPRRVAGETRARQLESMLITHLDTKDPFVNAHIGIEASLRFAGVKKLLQTIMVTSAVPREGKSGLVANLGMVLSLTGRPTVIVDSDLRKPIFYRLFGVDREPGLSNVVLGEQSLEDALVRPYASLEGKAPGRGMAQILLNSGKVTEDDLERALRRERQEGWQRGLEEILVEQGELTPADLEEAWEARQRGLENFHVLPPGPQPPNPTDFLGSEHMQAVIGELKGRFEVALFDSAPLLSVPDASVLSPHVDGTVLAIQAESTNREMVAQVVEQLGRAGANLVGSVLTQVSASTSRYYGGYYGYYYGYEPYGEDEEPG